MENEKLFEFMEKIYTELQSTKSEMQKGFKEVKEDIRKNTEFIVALEDELKENKKTLYDGYKQNAEMLSEVKEIVLKNTEEIQDISMTIIGMKEDINFIASKAIRNDSKIDKINEKLKAVK